MLAQTSCLIPLCSAASFKLDVLPLSCLVRYPLGGLVVKSSEEVAKNFCKNLVEVSVCTHMCS